MNETRSELTDEPVAVPADMRRDLRQRDVVARGVALLGDAGMVPAVEFLKSHKVKSQVIERVLLEPGRRADGA
jgi:hypothetical protein